MARLRRIVLAGHPHVIIQRGRSGQPVFVDATDRESFLGALRDAARASRVAIHAYGLQPNEVRLLVTPETEAGLAAMMQAVGRRFVRAYNRRHGRTGTPWEGRYRSTVIETASYLLACMRFTESAAAGGQFASIRSHDHDASMWSSAAHHLGERSDPLVSQHPAFWALGNTPFDREAAYRRFATQQPHREELAAILLSTLHGWVLGSAAFAAEAGEKGSRRPLPAARGRPRKMPLPVNLDDQTPFK